MTTPQEKSIAAAIQDRNAAADDLDAARAACIAANTVLDDARATFDRADNAFVAAYDANAALIAADRGDKPNTVA